MKKQKEKIKDTKAQTHTPSAMRHKIFGEVMEAWDNFEEPFKGEDIDDDIGTLIDLAISKTIEWKDKEFLHLLSTQTLELMGDLPLEFAVEQHDKNTAKAIIGI